MYKIYMKHKWILYLDLGPILKMFRYAYAIFWNPKKIQNLVFWHLWSQALQIKDAQPVPTKLYNFREFKNPLRFIASGEEAPKYTTIPKTWVNVNQ